MKILPSTRRIAITALVTILHCASAHTAPNVSVPGKNPFTIGAVCKFHTRAGSGVYKMDACRRIYCGDPRLKDIIEREPDFAARNKCTWVVFDDACRCQLNAPSTKPN